MHLLFKGKTYGNNSFFFISEIGRSNSNSAIQCMTNKEICCRKDKTGEWYFPDRSLVPKEYLASVFYRNRDDNGAVNLNRFDNIMTPTGRYCCQVPDANNIHQTLYVNIGKCIYILSLSQFAFKQFGINCFSRCSYKWDH